MYRFTTGNEYSSEDQEGTPSTILCTAEFVWGCRMKNPRPNICKVPHNFTGIDIREITELATA